MGISCQLHTISKVSNVYMYHIILNLTYVGLTLRYYLCRLCYQWVVLSL